MPILGIDEVGRGPWAGPLVIGAVILKTPQSNRALSLEAEDFLTATSIETDPLWDALTDSKKLSRHRRETLAPMIRDLAFATGLGWVPAEEVDELGLTKALDTAARRAVLDCLKNAGVEHPEKYVGADQNIDFEDDFPVDDIIIDGTENFLRGTPLESFVTVVPKGDLLVKEVSAASIMAKVAHDDYMMEVAEEYPQYGFENHVGYGTPAHRAALEKYGPCPEHRQIVRPVAKMTAALDKKNTTATGQAAEKVVAKYLEEQGHKILARNYKTAFYEIDIISATSDHIYFTEVKYRKTPGHGSPLEAITRDKYRRMTFAAEAFMKRLARRLRRKPNSLPSPILAAAAVSGDDFHLDGWFPLV